MPVAQSTISRSGTTVSLSMPASAQASRAAISESCDEGSSRLVSGRVSWSVIQWRAWPANSTGSSSSAKRGSSILVMPDLPASRASQVSEAVAARGEIAPIPVTTTVLLVMERLVSAEVDMASAAARDR